jgi:RNA polymerase sigma-70 factor (ECF subfamily)
MATVDVVLSRQTAFCASCPAGAIDREAFETAVKTYMPRLRRVALRILRNTQDAEDALQDALLAAFTKLSQFKGEAQITTWLTTIVLNSARGILRRQSAHKIMSLDEQYGENPVALEELVSPSGKTPEEIYQKQEYREALEQAMQQLSPKTRTTFRLVVLEGWSMRETADKMGVTEATVKARLFRARIDVKRRVRRSRRERRSAIPGSMAAKAKAA